MEATDEKIAVETKEEAKKLDLPRCEDTTFVYDNKTNMFWLGIPVNKTEPMIAMCIFDSMKMNYLGCFSKMIEEKKNKIELQSPGVLNQLRKNFVGKFKK